MMTVARTNWNFYGILEVNKFTFEDIKQRLKDQQLDWKYVITDAQGQELIVFGTTALRVEQDESDNRW